MMEQSVLSKLVTLTLNFTEKSKIFPVLCVRFFFSYDCITDNDVTILGTEISDGAYDENLDIRESILKNSEYNLFFQDCDKCNKFYRPYCRLHPLFKIPDRVLKRDESSNLSFSQQTLPILFRIEESKLPNAGLGVIAEVFIPVGMVFGPYKGRRCQKKTDFYKDGYAWLIKSGDKRFYIDGSDAERSNWLRYINSPRCKTKL